MNRNVTEVVGRTRSWLVVASLGVALAGVSAFATPPLRVVVSAAMPVTEDTRQSSMPTVMKQASDDVEPADAARSTAPPSRATSESATTSESDVPGDPPPAEPSQPVGRFPLEDILPKREIGAIAFLDENPSYDGRGTVVAIFDTGVDPGAPGLQVTTTGEPKIIDVIDGTGSGDVDTSTVVTLGEDGTFTGATGRPLTPDPAWSNPSGEFHVGAKPAYELFPRGLVDRLRNDRNDDLQEEHRPLLVKLREELAAWDREQPSPTRAQLREREELAARLEQAEKLGQLPDPGPVFDCVVFHDGETFRAAIDTDEDGEFADETTLTNFKDEREYATFDNDQLLNFVLNVYEEGDLLSVVVDVGAHGTHVAGIAAAHHPEQPEKNGVAPGAQIISVKIGDTRIGGGSTGTGAERGLIACINHGADVINMSYGGSTAFPGEGRLEELYREAVHDHNIVFLASAGNSGPALTTVGAPGGTSDWTIGVGATVTPSMMAAMHQVREPYDALQYTWSSRGPASDGLLGVDITAPGGAISSVPTWYHRGAMMMNGTSMSSPNAAGGIALLISALKQNTLGYSSQSIKRAIVNSAEPIPGEEPWGEGAGMLRVDRAWAQLYETAARPDRDVFYDVSLPEHDDARGVYLREPHETSNAVEPYVFVRPVFPEDYDSRKKVEFELPVMLETTADWVRAPSHTFISTGGDGFRFKVDATGLPVGAHFAELQGFDDNDLAAGPVFRVPITVIKPMELDGGDEYVHRETMRFEPGDIERRFIAVPKGATYADLAIRRLDEHTPSTIVLHMVQLHDDDWPTETNLRNYVRFDEGDEEVRSIAVVGGGTLEMTLAQFWASQALEGRFDVELSFHGLTPDSSTIVLDPTAVYTTTRVCATLRDETIAPRVTLTHRTRAVTPTSAKLRSLADGSRDEFPRGRRVHELVLVYDVSIASDGRYTIFDDSLPPVREYSSGLTEVFNSNNVRVGLGGWWRSLDLAEGEYTVRVHYRHTDTTELERLKPTRLHVREHLSRPLTLSVHHHPDRAWRDAGGHGSRDLGYGERRALHIANPSHDAYPDGAKPGDVLTGSMTFGQRGADFTGAGARPGGFDVSYTVQPKPEDLDETPTPSDANGDVDEPTPDEALRRDLTATRLDHLEQLASDDDAASLFDDVATHLRNESGRLAATDPDEARRLRLAVMAAELDRAVNLRMEVEPMSVVEAADTLIDAIDGDAIAAHEALDYGQADDKMQALSERYARERTQLVNALHQRAAALYAIAVDASAEEPKNDTPADTTDAPDETSATDAAAPDDAKDADATTVAAETATQPPSSATSSDGDKAKAAEDPVAADSTEADAERSLTERERFDAAFERLDRWVDMSDAEYVELLLDREALHDRPAVALELVNERLAAEPLDTDSLARRIELLERLGWDHIVRRERNRLLTESRDALPPI